MIAIDPHLCRCQHGIRWHVGCPACDALDMQERQDRQAVRLLAQCREGIDMPEAAVLAALRQIGEIPKS
jgi:hypothetical protein